MSSNAVDRAPKQKFVHATDNHIQIVACNKIYRLHDKPQVFNEKTAARTGKHAKRAETLLKAYMFEDTASITVLRLLALFKSACVSNEVSERPGLLNMFTFLTERLRYSLKL